MNISVNTKKIMLIKIFKIINNYDINKKILIKI
jgi:hypothetical protein